MNLSATPEKNSSIVSLTMLDVGTAVNAEASRALHQIIDPLPDFFGSKEEAKTFFGKIIPFTGVQKTMFEQFLLANLRDRNGKMVWVFDLSSIRDHLLSSLETPQTLMWKDLRVPTLVARGGNSEHFTQAELELLKESKPSIETALIPNAGHWVHVENLEGTFHVIKPFISKHT